jgi:transcriptional regulator GlxA family with amidase domain
LRLRFRTINGKSVQDEILDTRFKAVNRLLATTQYGIDHIAAKTGFSSAAFLSHSYSKRFGISPSEFRKKK